MDTSIPIIGANKTLTVELEVPAVFSCKLIFINHQQEYTSVDFGLPPGVYPNPDWLPKIVEDAYRNALKVLKLSTKDLSWRKCSPAEFVKATAGNQPVQASPKWKEPFSVKLQLEVPKVEADEDKQDTTPTGA